MLKLVRLYLWIFLLPLFIFELLAQDTLNWNGFSLVEFQHNGRSAKVVFPKKAQDSKPWIWRARFWGHEPQVDIALLQKGFHLVWIDVADLFGAPQAERIFTDFYDHLRVAFALSDKVVLEGFSRGGLIVYNWAANNVDKVSCIYADAPVCDFNSWPRGKFSGKGSQDAWKKCLDAYGLSNTQADTFTDIPIYTAREVAQAGIPVLHVCGATDEVVPIDENTYRLASIFKEEGAEFKVIVKEGIGHHPHSLQDPTPIVRFVLAHTAPKLLTEDLLKPAEPTLTCRSGLSQSRQVMEEGQTARVAFLGGSITHMSGWRDSIMHFLEHRFNEANIDFVNAGIPSMGSIPGAFRFRRDVLSSGKVDLLFVEAAVNDATNGRSPKAQVRGMEGIIRQALLANPNMDIVLMHFVDQDKMSDYNNGNIPEVIRQHELVAEYYQVSSINLAKEVNDRILNGEFSWRDDFKDLHPSPFGQGIYLTTMKTALAAWMDTAVQKPTLPSTLLDPYSYVGGGLFDIADAQLQQGWEYRSSWQPTDQLRTRPGFVDVPALVAEGPDASLSFTFEGTAIGIFVAAGADVGKISFEIDDGLPSLIDQFTQWSNFLHLPWLYVLDDELEPGVHKVTIRTTDQKNKNSLGFTSRIFHFAVNSIK
ncbi:MAG: prolyl oligopeptidase family serine peptidase [Saprospiraceae bacterium]|nr:prolyl oligopeptidase family serine peptidase [Saprospiraceae bacterium]